MSAAAWFWNQAELLVAQFSLSATALQSTVGQQVDLNTLLLGILLALAGWTLHGVHQLTVSHGRIEEKVGGSDGKGGHDGAIRQLQTDVEALRHAVIDIQAVLRMKRRRTSLIATQEEGAE